MQYNNFNIIIFSKDRALQLDSLLRSVKDNFKLPVANVYVLFKHSDQKIRQAYDILINRKYLNNIHWVREQDFRRELLQILQQIDNKAMLMFLVDDNVVFREFNHTKLIKRFSKKEHLFISLRASIHYKEPFPEFKKNNEFLEWKWTKIKDEWNTWGYPFSLDGNIFSGEIIKKLILKASFKAPNTLEANLNLIKHSFKLRIKNKALAPLEPVIFNNPLNKVQTEWETWNANYNVDELNDMYLAGMVLDNQLCYQAKPDAVHFYVEPLIKKLA